MLERLEIIGYIGKSAEIRHRKDTGVPFLVFPVVCYTQVTNEGGEVVQEFESWYQVRLNEIEMAACLLKGFTVFVSGRPILKPYLNKEDKPSASIEVWADKIVLIGSFETKKEE